MFNCISKGNVTWEFEDGDLPSNAILHVKRHARKTLVLSNVQLQNSGTYVCHGNDDGIDFLEQGSLTVTEKGY